MRNLFTDNSLKFFLIFFSLLAIFYLINNKNVNILNNKAINKGMGWENNQSLYDGSELNFVFSNSNEIIFEFDTNSKADQGVEILVDGKSYSISSPNLGSQKLSIIVDKSEPHAVTVRHFCTYLYDPCQITLKGIYVEKWAKILPHKSDSKILSILGDSISSIYGKSNYAHFLAQDLGYELHNSSIMGTTVSNVSGANSAIVRYKKDILRFKSDVIIVFMGTNDISKNVPLDVFERDYSKIASDMKKLNPDGKIFLVGILKRNDLSLDVLQNYNRVIEKVAEDYSLNYIDTSSWLEYRDFSDDVHPSLEIQKKLAEYFQNSLSPILK